MDERVELREVVDREWSAEAKRIRARRTVVAFEAATTTTQMRRNGFEDMSSLVLLHNAILTYIKGVEFHRYGACSPRTCASCTTPPLQAGGKSILKSMKYGMT
jgi:hypothetical protein